MRSIFAVGALALGALVVASGSGRAEITYPWCAQYSGGGMGGGRNCGFTTLQQCMATVSGIGGYCEANSMYRPGLVPTPRRPRG